MTVFNQAFTRKPLQSSVIKFFLAEEYNFEDVTIPGGSQVNGKAEFDVGTVLGQRTLGAASSAAKAGGNTGTGTLTLDGTTPVLANAIAGVYTVRCIAAATNNGTFRISDPKGRVLGDVVMAAGAGAWADQIKFALADGGTDFAVGDGFDVTIAAGDNKYVAHDEAALDGSQNAAAVVARNSMVDASNDATVAVLKRGPAVVVTDNLVFKTSISAAGKTAALAALEAAGIVSRSL